MGELEFSESAKTVSVFAVQTPLKTGFTDRNEAIKAYMTIIGGFLYMSVSRFFRIILSHNLFHVVPWVSICDWNDSPILGVLLRSHRKINFAHPPANLHHQYVCDALWSPACTKDAPQDVSTYFFVLNPLL